MKTFSLHLHCITVYFILSIGWTSSFSTSILYILHKYWSVPMKLSGWLPVNVWQTCLLQAEMQPIPVIMWKCRRSFEPILNVPPVAGHLKFVVPPLVISVAGHNQEKGWRPTFLLLPVHFQQPLCRTVLLIHLLVGNQRSILRVLLGFVEKLFILLQQNPKDPIPHQLAS